MGRIKGALCHCCIPTSSYARTVSIAIGRSASNYIPEEENK